MLFVHTPPRSKVTQKFATRQQNNQSTNFSNLVFKDTQYTQQSPAVGKCQKKQSSIQCGQYWEKESVSSQAESIIMQTNEAEQIKQLQEQRCLLVVGKATQQSRVRMCAENQSNQQQNCMKDVMEQNNNYTQQTRKPTNSELMSNVLQDWGNGNCAERFPTKNKRFYEMQQERQVVQVQKEIADEKPRFYEKRG